MFRSWSIVVAPFCVIAIYCILCLSVCYILYIYQNWTLTSVYEAPNPSPNTFSESYIIVPTSSSIYSWSVLFYLYYIWGRGTVLCGHVGGEGGGGNLLRSGEGVVGGALFVRVWFLLLYFYLFQVPGWTNIFSLGCSRHRISWCQYLSSPASLIQSWRVPFKG